MTTVAKTFSAAGSSPVLTVVAGQSVTYAAITASFVGVVAIETSITSGAAWAVLASATDAGLASREYKNDTAGAMWFRFVVSQNGATPVSGEIAVSVADVAIPNPAVPGAATEAEQENANALLTTIDATLTASDGRLQALTGAFGGIAPSPINRIRTVDVHTLFDGKTVGTDLTDIWNTVGTGTHTQANNVTTLAVTAGQYLVRQTKEYFQYFSGQPQLVETTTINFQSQAGVEKGTGYISSSAVAPYTADYDGFAIVDTGTTKELRIYNKGNLTAIDWTDWDNYAEVAAYNWANFTVFLFDFLWLGGTALRMVLKLRNALGEWITLHTHEHAGNFPTLIFESPHQPIRHWIRSTSGVGSFKPVCCAVGTEGNSSTAYPTRAVYNTAAIAANAVGTVYALAGVRKLAAYRDVPVQISRASVAQLSANDGGMLLLLRNPTLSAPITYATAGRIETGLATTQTVSALGDVLNATPIFQASGEVLSGDDRFFLGSTIANVMDEFVLAYQAGTNNQTVLGSMSYTVY